MASASPSTQGMTKQHLRTACHCAAVPSSQAGKGRDLHGISQTPATLVAHSSINSTFWKCIDRGYSVIGAAHSRSCRTLARDVIRNVDAKACLLETLVRGCAFVKNGDRLRWRILSVPSGFSFSKHWICCQLSSDLTLALFEYKFMLWWWVAWSFLHLVQCRLGAAPIGGSPEQQKCFRHCELGVTNAGLNVRFQETVGTCWYFVVLQDELSLDLATCIAVEA